MLTRPTRPFLAWALAAPLAVVSLCATAHLAMDETSFNAENAAAMDKMMAGMSVTPSGDIDRDFTAMMIPHHQGAIDMALAELRHGHNEQLRRIAQEIIVEQRQEIEAMHLAIGQPPLEPAPVQTEASPASAEVASSPLASPTAPAHPHSSMAMPMGGSHH